MSMAAVAAMPLKKLEESEQGGVAGRRAHSHVALHMFKGPECCCSIQTREPPGLS